MLYTSMRILGVSDRTSEGQPFYGIVKHFGKPTSFGHDRPIDFAAILGLGLVDDAMAALDMVYPEQATLASRIARRLAVHAYRCSASRFGNSVGHIDNLVSVAEDYLIARVGLKDLRKPFNEAARIMSRADSYLAYLAGLAVSCLAPYPEKTGSEILQGLRLSSPLHPSVVHESNSREDERAFRLKFLSMLESLPSGGILPVHEAYSGPFDGTRKNGLPSAMRRKPKYRYGHRERNSSNSIKDMLKSRGY